MQLDHIVLTAKDIHTTAKFYEQLGFELRTFKEDRLALHFGQQKINLHQSGKAFEPHAKHPTPGSLDLCFLLDDPLQSFIDRLENRGIPIIEGPIERTGASGPIMSIYIRDPEGNLLEFSAHI